MTYGLKASGCHPLIKRHLIRSNHARVTMNSSLQITCTFVDWKMNLNTKKTNKQTNKQGKQ